MLLDILVIYENEYDYYLVWVALAISIASLIAASVMFFFASCIIWSVCITVSLTLCNAVGFIRSYYHDREIDDYPTLPYLVMTIISVVFLVLSLLVLWARLAPDILLPALLILFLCYTIVIIGLLLWNIFGFAEWCTWISLNITIFSMIAVIVLLCIRSCAVWALGITITLTVGNVCGMIGQLIAGSGDDAKPYIMSLVISAIFLVISILVISFGYGWGAYNII